MTQSQIIMFMVAGACIGAFVINAAAQHIDLSSMRRAGKGFAESSVRVPMPVLLAILLGIAALFNPFQYLPDSVLPEPEPPAPVVDVDSLCVLIVEETEDRIKHPAQNTVIHGSTWRELVKDAKGQFQIVDDDVDLKRAPQWVVDAMNVDRDSTPWLYIVTPKTIYSGPVPETEDVLIDLLKKHGE